MKKIISSIAFLLLALLCPEAIAAQQPRPEPGKIIIKFKENSLAAMQWTGAARTGEIAFLKKIIGSHTTRPFVGDNVLKAVQKKLNGQNPRRTNQSSLVESLSRIALVEITQPLEVQTLLLKISSYPDIEYAEPQYTRLIYEIPDDPLLSQQSYLQQVRVFDAWDNIAEPARRPIVAIVDTGVDYLHEDLVSNIFINTGEDGADTQGRSRRNNGVDDDANGFVDDWRGWDFTAIGNSSAQDNDPMPGHPHGTHVAGLAGAVTNNSVGIASAGRWVQILPVKIGPSDPNSLSVYNSYEGILYAATMGADVINSSWGGPGSSEAEKEITDAALALGSLIVAAAGNDNIEGGFYPAAYPGVISVASVSGTDVKSSFSNYHMSVDVSAPGDQIFSTVPGNSYTHMSGTSMASPIAAGIAALIKIQFPHYTPLQIGAQLKATTDSIDFRNNQQYHSRLGSGRINALKAITETNVRAALITNFTIEDADQDSILEAGEELKVYFTLHNVLAAINNARIEVSSITSISPLFLQKVISVGTMGTNEIRSITDPVIFTIPTDVPYNYDFQLAVDITDNQGRVSREVINITVRPSYRTFSSNNITATFNSEGNIGFNDYPTNIQGKGFYYKGSDNLLYEGALIAGISPDRLSNVARNINQIERDRSFHPIKVIGLSSPGILAVAEGETIYADDNDPREDAGVSVRQKIYQFNESGREDFIITTYDITNISSTDFENFYAGIFFDWDIGPGGQDNQARFSDEHGFGYTLNTRNTTLPWVGVQVLSHQPNYYAIDNDGSGGSINIYNGYSRSEKWATLTSVTRRKQSGVGDVSFIISAGPLRIRRGDTARIAFSLMASLNFEGLRNASVNSFATARELGITITDFIPTPAETRIINVYPNPVMNNEDIVIEYALAHESSIELRIVDILGKTVAVLAKGNRSATVQPTIVFKSAELAQGQYFVQLITETTSHTAPFAVFK